MKRTIKLTRETLMLCVADAVRKSVVGLADMDCVAMNAVLEGARKGETFPLDTIEVELVASRPRGAGVDMAGSNTPRPTHNKIRLASVDGERV